MTQQTSNDKPPVAAAIITNDGHVLLVRRRVSEGTLSWQFPAGEIESGETAEEAAVRETKEEVRLTVGASKTLGDRIHPATGRTMVYVACELISGDAHVADSDEIAEIAWCKGGQLADYIPHKLFPAVQDHLDATLVK